MHRQLYICVLSALSGSLPALAAAAAPADPPSLRPAADAAAVVSDEAGLTVEQAVAIALRDNPELQAVRKGRAVAEGEIRSATALTNPTLQLQLLHAQDSTQLGWGALLKWMPPQPVTLLARRDQARAHLTDVGQQVAELEWTLGMQVRSVFATLLELREQTRIATTALAMRKRVTALVRTQVQRGRSTRIDQNLADLALLDAQRELDDIELRTTQAQLRLHALLGKVGLEPLPLKGAIAAEIKPVTGIDAEKFVERALAARPALKAAQARITFREQGVRLERSRVIPWFELSGRYRMNSSQRFPHDVQLGLELSLPILNANGGPIAVAKAELDREQAQVQALAQAVRQSVYAATGELLIRQRLLVRSQREVLPVLVEHERLLEAALRGAELDLVGLLSSEQSILRGRRQHSEARLGYEQALIALQAAVGVPLAELLP